MLDYDTGSQSLVRLFCPVAFSKMISLLVSKDTSIQVELVTEEKDAEPTGSKKKRLESVPSSESLASSGFLEDKSLSDVEEEEEGMY